MTLLVAVGIIGYVASASSPSQPVRVGVLSGHNPSKFSNTTCTTGDSQAQAGCNLAVFVAAVATAAQHGVEIMVMPEAYSLGHLGPKTVFEPIATTMTVPCSDSTAGQVQRALSCMAAKNGVAVAANIFGCRSSTTCSKTQRRLTEVVFDKSGALLVSYDKHHLFVNEMLFVTAGPFAPATFELMGRVWGILICYEGVWPVIGPGGNWSQSDDIILRQNATELIWSIGSAIPTQIGGDIYTKRYGSLRSVLAAEDSSTGAITCAEHGCNAARQKDFSVHVPAYLGYQPRLAVRTNTLL